MKLFLLRHFQRFNDTSFYSSLTLEGFTNSFLIIEELKSKHLNYIYTSPFLRALESVYPFAKQENIEIRVEPIIGEMRNSNNFEPAYLFEKGIESIPLKYFQVSDIHYRPLCDKLEVKEPESFDDVVKRTIEFVEHLNKLHSKNARILIVTHSSVINAFKRIYNNVEDADEAPHPYEDILEIDV